MSSFETTLSSEFSELRSLSRQELLSEWHKAYGSPPFKGARNTTLVRGLAYHIQCKRAGALKPSLSRQMLKIAKSDNSADTLAVISQSNRRKAKPKTKLGSQLIREWNGRTHTVHVTDKGFVMSGITYSSLSAAAKAITGAHWSGPRFFGVEV